MSRLPFELMLALRYVRPKRTFVSVITLISIIGVMLGVAVLIIVISVMSGFDLELRDKIVSFNAHLRIEPAEGTMRDYEGVMETALANPKVKGATPYVVGQVLVSTQPKDGSSPRVVAPLVRGIDPEREGTVSRLPEQIIAGEYDVRGFGMLVGRQFAGKMGLRVGDAVAVYSVRAFQLWEQSRREEAEEAYLAEDYTIRGIFDMGIQDFDSMFVVCSLPNAQDLYNLDNSVHGLLLSLHDPERAGEVKAELIAALGGGYDLQTWMEENSEILDVLVVEKHMMFYLLFFITLVASFGICSALITFVVQKTREIGALKALGATNGQVMRLFLTQSLLVGAVGVTTGFGLGLLAVEYRNDFLTFMRRATGIELFPSTVYHFYEIPAALIPGDIAVICGGALLICLVVGGLIPAWSAARLKPAEALRHE